MVQLDENALSIFVDGSSYSGPRSGGIGVRLVWTGDDGHPVVVDLPTNFSYEGGRIGQMELQAAIHALEEVLSRYSPVALDRLDKIDIYTDSEYLARHFDDMKFRWPKNGWLGREDRPILNLELWKNLRKLVVRLDTHHHLTVRAEWRPGKKGEHAKAVDRGAKRSAKSPTKRKLEHERARSKWSPNAVEIGCVQMRGQEEVVRVFNDRVARRGLYLYRYEVVDAESPDYQLVDDVFSEHLLKAGHVYIIRFNENTKNPRIAHVLCEVLDAEGKLPNKATVADSISDAREGRS